MLKSVIYQGIEKDLDEYINYIKNSNSISLNDFIKNKYFANDNDKIVIVSLADMEISSDLTNANLQGSILKGAIFNDCNFSDTILCDTDLTDVKFNDCKFIGTDFRGANLHYVDFNYKDYDYDTALIPNLKDKIQDIKISFSDLEQLNKYIDKDIEKERQQLPAWQAKAKEFKDKQDELEALKQNLNNPGIITNFFNSEETVNQNHQNELKKSKDYKKK